jgi:hypothetical protein
VIHEHVRQLGFAEGHDAGTLFRSTLLWLMIEHFAEATHEVHQGCVDQCG